MFVQYGKSVATEVARAVAESLKGAGYVVPTEDRIPNNAREVRFFHQQDRAAADDLAQATASTLQGLGFPGLTVEVRDFTGWNKAKPRDGTLELWLALPDVKQAFADRAMFVDPSESPAAFRKSMAAEMQRMAKLVKDAGIEPQ